MTCRYPCLIRFSLLLGTLWIVLSSPIWAQQQTPPQQIRLTAQSQKRANAHFISLWFIGLYDAMTPEAVTDALKAGADVNVKRNDGETALITVARFDDAQDIGNGAHALSQIYSDILSQMITEQEARNTMMKLLLDAGANANLKTDQGETALIAAASPPFPTELLDENLGWSDSEASRIHTALLMAADEGDDRVIQLLLKYGADVNAKYDTGETALSIATKAHDTGMVTLLQSAGAK